nr:2-succinylbenzoate--CoA ligase [Oscillatoria sp. FACHB-1406]
MTVDRILSHLQQHERNFAGFDNRQVYPRARSLADFFEQYPAPPIVLLAEPNPLAFLSTFLAAVATHCPIFLGNPAWQEREWQQVFTLVQPDLIFGRVPPQFQSVQSSLPQTSSQKSPLPGAIYIPTGGTSGRVRFATHTWQTLSYSVQGFSQYFNTKSINSFCTLPLFHVSGLMQFMRSFLSSGTFYYCPYSDLKCSRNISLAPENYFISLVPTQLRFLLDEQADWLAQFHTVLLGGAPAWDDLLTKARAKNIRLALTYGMTETASQIATLKPEDFLQGNGSNGSVLPHAKITIILAKNELLSRESIGVIGIEAKSLFLGYYPDVLPSDRLYLTDDLGYWDDRGDLNLIGRNSQKIITGGENVFPSEVEAAILATQFVEDVCVVGMPDAIWGQAVTAVYVPKNDRVAVPEIESAIATKISKFKHPKHWIRTESLPRNDRGKINCDRVLEIARTTLSASQKVFSP